jgi:UDP-N-acetyl-2-amino-2-deoxyglucuronate dehydrogenase
MKNFVLIGAAGFIAPKHMAAIKKTKNNLIAAFDINSTVGILDRFFPDCIFFNKFNDLKKFIKKNHIDYIVITTPNYLHYKYIKFALENKINVICEKPLVLKSKNIKILERLEKKFNKKIYVIFQLRLINEVYRLKKYINNNKKKKYKVKIRYITPRGDWYKKSWKNNSKKSGGITTNLGVHLFDLLIFLFGISYRIEILMKKDNKVSGIVKFDNCYVNWFLSNDFSDLKKINNKQAHRVLIVNEKKINLTKKFEDLHYSSYLKILSGKGFGLEQAKHSVYLTEKLNDLEPPKKKYFK